MDQRVWTRHYAPGVPLALAVPPESIVDMFRAQVTAHGDSDFLQTYDTTSTFAQVDADSDALAAALTSLGVGHADRVGIALQNTPEFVLAALATWKVGGVVLPINPMYRERELSKIVTDAQPRVLFLDPAMHAVVAGAGVPASVEIFYGANELAAPINDLVRRFAGTVAPDVTLQPDDIALLTYTSGTTGDPKGAIHTHRNMSYQAALGRTWLALEPGEDSVLSLAPMFHITGMILHLSLALSSGSRLVLTDRFQPRRVAELIERYRPTFSVGAITAYIALMNDEYARNADLSSLTKVLTGGAPVPAATVTEFRKQFGIYLHNAFGMTETTSAAVLVPLGAQAPIDPASGAVSVGVPVPNMDIKVLDLDGAELPPGEVGELAMSGPQVVAGYWRRPDATAAMSRDGYLLSGDMAMVDENGWVFLVDRKKDMIIASGYKIWPREVEDVLYEHPAVREAAVVGVEDDYRGQSVRAFVSLKPGMSVGEEQLIEHCRERLAAYKNPREIVFLEDLPKTISGKILRRELRAAVS